jgi:hypothetical protein
MLDSPVSDFSQIPANVHCLTKIDLFVEAEMDLDL